jgi:hypothetical protein
MLLEELEIFVEIEHVRIRGTFCARAHSIVKVVPDV